MKPFCRSAHTEALPLFALDIAIHGFAFGSCVSASFREHRPSIQQRRIEQGTEGSWACLDGKCRDFRKEALT